jgi:hypothetical protein
MEAGLRSAFLSNRHLCNLPGSAVEARGWEMAYQDSKKRSA